MRRITLSAALACLGAGGSALAEPATVTCVVDARQVLGPVHRGLYGTNLEWFNGAGGLAQPSAAFDPVRARLAEEEGVSILRFPGGTLADLYHWRDGVGPRERRPIRPHHTDPGSSNNLFGTPELLRLSQAIGAQPLITVNVGSGTASEAADWVRYCNAPGDAARKADGLAAAAPVALWELGNELYLAGSGVERQLGLAPEAYATRFVAFARAMRTVDPKVKLMAIGIAQSYSVPFGPHQDWTETVLSRVAEEADYVAVHNAYFPALIGVRDASARDVYEALWASPEAVDRSLTELEAIIARHERGRRIGIAVTEWGPLFSINDPKWIDHVKTLGSAVFVARVLQVFLAHPRVEIANYFKLADAAFMGWIGHDARPKLPFYALQLYAKHFGTRRVAATVDGPRSAPSKRLGLAGAQGPAPLITAVASLDEAGARLYVNLVNRSWDRPQRVQVKLAGFSPADGATVYELSGPSAGAHDGPDLPRDWPLPIVEPGEVRAQPGLRVKRWDPRAPLEVPPHSVVTVELSRQ